MGNHFPTIGINTDDLIAHVEALLAEAATHKADMGAVNWGDLGVCDVEYRLSMLNPEQGPQCVVLVEEAEPHCWLAYWLTEHIDHTRFPNVHVECEW